MMDTHEDRPRPDLWPFSSRTAFWIDLIPDIEDRIRRNTVDNSAIDRDIRDLFLHHAREYADKLDASVESQDEATVRSVAHAFQGTGGAIGAPDLSGFGEALSFAARAGDWRICGELATRLRKWIGLQTVGEGV